jgi:hypothetical protein
MCSLSKRLPTLTEFMSLDQWEDGASRVRGTIRLMIEDDVWKACLNNLDESSYAFLSSRTLTGLLEAQSVDWRVSKPLPGEKGKGGGRR